MNVTLENDPQACREQGLDPSPAYFTHIAGNARLRFLMRSLVKNELDADTSGESASSFVTQPLIERYIRTAYPHAKTGAVEQGLFELKAYAFDALLTEPDEWAHDQQVAHTDWRARRRRTTKLVCDAIFGRCIDG